MRKYNYAWLTLGFFLVSLILHWWFGYQAAADDAKSHGEALQTSAYLHEMLRDTFENWQSDFLQLLWQVVGLAYFLYVGSPSSKEGGDRLEAKVDAMMRMIGGEKAQEVIAKLDQHYLRGGGHAKPHGHDAPFIRDIGLNVAPRR
ncbi:DUF6766 family protein [Sphingomonas humi]|uniref:Uncharacterized protein n=1 Tax=Sphingomonas humi TaxID=335630 RepID=A0ABP7S4W2_9SPHN